MGAVPYWRLSGFYFFYFGSLGIFLPYWSLYLQSEGYSPQEIGGLTALLAGSKIVAPNVLGWLADHFGRTMRVIQLSSLAASLLFIGFFFKPGFWGMAMVTLAFSFFWNAALPQFEAVTLAHLKSAISQYSRIRLWGSVGFILTVVGIGQGLSFISVQQLPVVISLFLVAIWINSLLVPDTASNDVSAQTRPVRKEVRFKTEIVALLAALMLLQIAHAPYYVFFSIFLADHGYAETAIGVLWALGVIAEIGLFLVMHQLLHRFSLKAILMVSIWLAVVRWLLIGWGVDNMTLLIFAQLLHAATFGSSHVAAIQLIHGYFRDQQQNRGQALYSSVSFGLGGMLGSFCSGILWEDYGALVLYSLAATASFLAAVIVWCWVGQQQATNPV